MQNLILDDLSICEYHPDISAVEKILRHGNQTATFAFENVYLHGDKLLKLNRHPVKQAEWFQVANIIFMQTACKFEWYDLSKGTNTSINFPQGFSSCSWNPSQTVLAVLYTDGSVQLVAVDFYKKQLIPLEKCDVNCDIQIGDDNDGVVVWNKEGDSFLVAYSKNKKITFNVYTERCELFAKAECEDVDLLPIFAWSSSGSLIGTLEKNQDKLFVRFFENNGLKKDLLPIPHQEDKMKKCCFEWSSSDDLFALMFVGITGKSALWLYSHENYQWQVKQSLHATNNSFTSFDWLPVAASSYSLKVLTSTSELVYKFSRSVAVSDQYLAVIDGYNLKLTHIDNEIKPAPISTIKHKYPAMINEVKFSPGGEFLAVLLCNNFVYVTQLKTGQLLKLNLEELIGKSEIPLCLNNCVVDNNKNLYLIHNSKDKHWVYRLCNLYNKYQQNINIIHESTTKITQLHLTENSLLVKTVESVVVYNGSALDCLETKEYLFPSQITAVHINDIVHMFSLCDGKFWCDDNLVMGNVTSYLICHGYVMLTTANDTLFCFDLNNNENVKNQKVQTALYERSIPKGAILICFLPYSSSVVLQLERGDFETIKPRILSIRFVKSLLGKKKYAEASNIVKYDRLNTDVLVDLDYDNFMSNIEQFVCSFEQVEFLNVFITGLQDENVVNRLYKNCILGPIKKVESKKQTVLCKMIAAIEKVDRVKYLSSIVTARIMLNQFEEMLLDFKWALEQQNTINVDVIFDTVKPLINPEVLLNAALALQQFDMVQWVANKTQMDPLEYMPFINELADMDSNYRSYKINIHLKKYGPAFESLIKCDHDVQAEIIHLIDSQDLYRFAIRRIRPNNKWYNKIMEKCAETLTSRKIYSDAGLLYKKINKFEEALECFVNDANFNEFNNMAQWVMQKGISINIRSYHQRLVKKLVEAGKVRQAAKVFELLDNYEEGISLLVNNKLWSEAFEYISRHNRYDLIVSDFHPAISMYASELCQQFLQKSEQFEKYSSRLEVVRTDKLNMLTLNGTRDLSNGFSSIGFNESEDVHNADVESLLSMLSVTTKTAVTNTSSSTVTRKKKKLARKTLQIREGSVFENIALIRQLHVIATELYGYANIVNETCYSLLGLDDSLTMDSAAKLHSTYSDSLFKVAKQIDKIWSEEFINLSRPLNAQVAVLRMNIEHLESQFRFPPKKPSSDWIIYSLT